jgi:hypothetical protein
MWITYRKFRFQRAKTPQAEAALTGKAFPNYWKGTALMSATTPTVALRDSGKSNGKRQQDLGREQPRDLVGVPPIPPCRGPHAARCLLMLERYLGAGGMAEE